MKDDIDKKWTDRKLIEETIRSMSLHNEPAPETRERLSTLEANYENMDKKIDNILTKFDKLECKLDSTFEKQDNRIGKLYDHKNYLWGAYTALVITAGVIITLTINAINTKITEGIAKALKDNVSSIEYEN